MSTRFIHQLLTRPQIIDSREGFLGAKRACILQTAYDNPLTNKVPLTPNLCLASPFSIPSHGNNHVQAIQQGFKGNTFIYI